MRKEKRWHRDDWEGVHRLKRVKITRDRFTSDVLCCNSILLYLRKIGDLQLKLCCVPNVYLILFGATNHPQVLLISTLFRFVLLFTNLSQVHWRESTTSASENDSRWVTNIFAISVFPSVCPAFKPRKKRGFAWNCRWWGGEGSMKICRPDNFYYNRTKLTVSVREKARTYLVCMLYK